MARKIKRLTIAEDGRDKGKTYVLTEMSAVKAEKWAARLYQAMVRAGVDVPDTVSKAGVVGIILVGVNSVGMMPWAEAEVLLDEMLACVTVAPMPNSPEIERPLADGDIEEVATLVSLRAEIISLHTGFTWADVRSALEAMQAAQQSQQSPANSSTTPTSPG